MEADEIIFRIIWSFISVYLCWCFILMTWSPFNNWFDLIERMSITERCVSFLFVAIMCKQSKGDL
jgi:hypothetical protein